MALTSPSLDASPICVRGSESADQVRRLTRRWALRGVGKGARLVKTFRLWGEKGPVPPLFGESFRLWGVVGAVISERYSWNAIAATQSGLTYPVRHNFGDIGLPT